MPWAGCQIQTQTQIQIQTQTQTKTQIQIQTHQEHWGVLQVTCPRDSTCVKCCRFPARWKRSAP